VQFSARAINLFNHPQYVGGNLSDVAPVGQTGAGVAAGRRRWPVVGGKARVWPCDGSWPGSRSSGCVESRAQRRVAGSADELVGGEGHHLGLVAVPVILPREGTLAVFESQEAPVGDGHAVGIAAEIL